MAVGLQRFEIVLDSSKDSFSPGEKIVGRVIVELARPKTIRGLKIRFKGNCEVKWGKYSDSEPDNAMQWYTSTETYFRTEFYELGGAENTENIEIQTGHHVFPFNFSLPHNIPSSFEHKYGSVRYTIKAVLDRPWKFDHQTSMVFTVETPYDLSRNPAARLGISEDEHDTFCCFSFFNMGSMSLNISVPVSGFAVGEDIDARFTINNNSTSVDVTKILLQLRQEIKFKAPRCTTRDINFVQKAEKKGPFSKRDEIVVSMQVPSLPTSNFPHCSLIDIDYYLIIQVAVSGWHCNTDRIYPISIGSKSAINLQPMQNAHAISAPVQKTIVYPPIQPNAPSAPFFGTEEPTPSAMPFPEKTWNEKSGPKPYPPNPSYGFVLTNQPYPQPRPDSSASPPFQYPPTASPPFQYPPTTNPANGIVGPIPGQATTSTTENPPPSYDDFLKLETKK